MRDQYDDDLANRYEHGDFFHKDSTLVKNGGKYYTQILKREVSRWGGITPDLFVPMPEVYKNPLSLVIKSYLSEFVFQYFAQHTITFPTDQKSLASWSLPEDIYTAMHHFLKSKTEDFPDPTSLPDLKGFEKDIKHQVMKLLLPA